MKNLFDEDFFQKTLKYAGIYNILWGAFIVLFPNAVFDFLHIPRPNYVEIWQCIGMIVGVYGIGYFIASKDPVIHWPIVLVGFLGKIFGIVGFFQAVLIGSFPLKFIPVILFNDIIWILPFYYALIYAYESHSADISAPKKFSDLIKYIKTNQGDTLFELSKDKKVLLIFVRHLGCTFCRETVSEIAKLEENLKGKNLTSVFVHMSDPSFGDEFFAKYFDHKISHISDPQRLLYRSLNLNRGSFFQIFGIRTFFRGVWAGLFKGHGIGQLEGDPLQLGGVFILANGHIVFEHKNANASDFFKLNILPEI